MLKAILAKIQSAACAALVVLALAAAAPVVNEAQAVLPPLHQAAEDNDVKKMRQLIANGAIVDLKIGPGMTALHAAARGNADEAAQLLIDGGANIHAKIRVGDGLTPLQIASFHNSRKAGIRLLAAGAKMDAHIAAWLNATGIVKSFIVNGGDINARNHWNQTLLHMASRSTDPIDEDNAMLFLIVNGADVNAEDNGRTPLHGAARFNALSRAPVLIEYGADVNAKDKDGETPLDYAIEEGHAKMQSLLRRHGGSCNKKCQ